MICNLGDPMSLRHPVHTSIYLETNTYLMTIYKQVQQTTQQTLKDKLQTPTLRHTYSRTTYTHLPHDNLHTFLTHTLSKFPTTYSHCKLKSFNLHSFNSDLHTLLSDLNCKSTLLQFECVTTTHRHSSLHSFS